MNLAPVLVLSSFAENRQQLAEWLAPLGRECVLLASADELWSRLWQDRLEPPALLVLDAHPAEEAYPLINRLQGDQAGAQLPVLLLSDNLGDASQRFYTELLYGVERLCKPVSEAMLFMTAEACLRLDDARRRIEAALVGPDWAQTLREPLLALGGDGRILYANREAGRCLRLSPLALCRLNVQTLLEAPVKTLESGWDQLPLAHASAEQIIDIKRLQLWRGDGAPVQVQAALVPFPAFSRLLAFRPLAGGDDEERQALSDASRMDFLSGLPSRPHLEEAMAALLQEGLRPALLVLDIDHLRHVNETLGHEFGDQLLRAASGRLRSAREAGLLASMGGGSFAFLVDHAPDYRVAGRVGQRLQAQFRLPFLLAGHEVFCSISIGIAMSPTSGDSPEHLLKGAERALFRAKQVGRNVIQFDAAELNRFSIEHLERESALKQALDSEALTVGWKLWRDTDGCIQALQPCPLWPAAAMEIRDLALLAEECGLSRELGDLLFSQSVSQVRPALARQPGLRLAFEVSLAQMQDPAVLQRFRAALQKHQLAPSSLHLFLPWQHDEGGVLARRVSELAAMGVNLSLLVDSHIRFEPELLDTAPWQGLVLRQDYLARLTTSRSSAFLTGIAQFARHMGWTVMSDGLPAGVDAEQAFRSGIELINHGVEPLPALFD